MSNGPKTNSSKAKIDRNLQPRPNQVRRKLKAALSVAPNNDFFSTIQTTIANQNQPDTISGKTEFYGVCLRVTEVQNSAGERSISCRARIPEIHSHLPVPRSGNPNDLDHQVVDLYPQYVLEAGTQPGGELVPGKILRLTHIDKNYTSTQYNNGRILEILDEASGWGAGFNSITQECKDAFEAERSRLAGKPKTKDNKEKRDGKRLNRPAGEKSQRQTILDKLTAQCVAAARPGQNEASCEKFAEESFRMQLDSGRISLNKTDEEILTECKQKTNMEVYLGTAGDAYVRGQRIGTVSLITITGQFPGGRGKYKVCNGGLPGLPAKLSTYHAYIAMSAAAKAAGIKLQITSGFRTMEEQTRLKKKKPSLAAKPGYSNHQNGIAIDMDCTNIKVYEWLTRNAINFGFIRTVPWEIWHWEFKPEMTQNQFRYVKRSYNSGVTPKPVYTSRSGKRWTQGHWPAIVGGKESSVHTSYAPDSWIDINYWQNDSVTHGATKKKRQDRATQRAKDAQKKAYEEEVAKVSGWINKKYQQLNGAKPTTQSKGQLQSDIKRLEKNLNHLLRVKETGTYKAAVESIVVARNDAYDNVTY